MSTPLRLTYLRHALNSEAHPDSSHHEASRPCPGCIWAVDEKNGEQFLLWSIISPHMHTYVIHRLDSHYADREHYGDIEVVGINEKAPT